LKKLIAGGGKLHRLSGFIGLLVFFGTAEAYKGLGLGEAACRLLPCFAGGV
jgi:hypothetical protein